MSYEVPLFESVYQNASGSTLEKTLDSGNTLIKDLKEKGWTAWEVAFVSETDVVIWFVKTTDPRFSAQLEAMLVSAGASDIKGAVEEANNAIAKCASESWWLRGVVPVNKGIMYAFLFYRQQSLGV